MLFYLFLSLSYEYLKKLCPIQRISMVYKYKYWTFNFAQNSIFTFLIKMIANSEKNLLIQQYIYIYFLYQSNRFLHFSQVDLS